MDEPPKGRPTVPIEGEPKSLEVNSIFSSSMPTFGVSFEPISKLILDPDNPNGALPSMSYDDPVIHSRDSLRHPRHGSHEDHKFNQEEKP